MENEVMRPQAIGSARLILPEAPANDMQQTSPSGERATPKRCELDHFWPNDLEEK